MAKRMGYYDEYNFKVPSIPFILVVAPDVNRVLLLLDLINATAEKMEGDDCREPSAFTRRFRFTGREMIFLGKPYEMLTSTVKMLEGNWVQPFSETRESYPVEFSGSEGCSL